MAYEREDETQTTTAPDESPDKDDLPAEPSDDDAPLGDSDEHSGESA
jgi:hypothetical protein